MLAHRKQLTLVSTLPDLSIQTPTLINDSLLKPPTPTSNDSTFYRLQHRRNPSMPHPVTPSSPLTPSTPRSPLHHHRRRTYGGDVSPTTRTPLLNVEEKIALLESTNKRLSVELEETRDALLTERDGRIAYPESQATTPQSEVVWERKLRMEMLEALKKVRTQNTVLSRSVREHQEHCESLSSLLAEERAQRETAEDELSRLAQVNFTLFEHNKLLVERDLAFQKMTSSPHPGDPLEFQNLKPADDDSLRTQLNAATDELHITNLRLAASEEKCSDLSEHVSFLQQQMTQCLDSSAQALEVERELRAEFMGRANIALEENERLRAQISTVERQLHSSRTSVRRVVALPERISIRLQRRRQRKKFDFNFFRAPEEIYRKSF
ncbi:hypothetical protein BDZ89DRAFT_289576 [Hymenopellis radicata]|nr:hypothetical protein BDZ89DRAFT_289576 [Hymenopellis radicata]